jgi:hypothetical protein
MKKDSKQEPFSLFGGTSMAAPLVSGAAALLMQAMNEKSENYDPFRIKNILMSTATDLDNDVFTQGAGLVNATNAINFVKGNAGVFVVYNNSTFSNIKKILDDPIDKLNSNILGIDNFTIPEKNYPQTSWFGGYLLPGERSTTMLTIENPTNNTLKIEIKPQTFKLIKQIQFNGTTEVRLQDSILNKSDTYIPNYVSLSGVKGNPMRPATPSSPSLAPAALTTSIRSGRIASSTRSPTGSAVPAATRTLTPGASSTRSGAVARPSRTVEAPMKSATKRVAGRV